MGDGELGVFGEKIAVHLRRRWKIFHESLFMID